MSFPLTSDSAAIAQFFRQLEPNDMPVGGTAIARALERARELLARDPNRRSTCASSCSSPTARIPLSAYTLSLDEVGERAEQAWAAGASEVCMQGGINPSLPATAYFDLAGEVKKRVPGMHVHAFSPMEVVTGAARTGMSIEDWLVAARDAGVDTIPGTAAEILDDEIRWILTKGKLPADKWVEVITTAHRVGLRSSSTMMYGHVDQPRHWVAHLRLLARLQEETGGFTEFVPLPFIHQNSPIYLAGIARPGPTMRENRAVHAMARLLLHGRIDNIQCSWVKLGVDGCRVMLRGGANDLGGTLMEETISRMAGSQFGSLKTIAAMREITDGIGRPLRQRDTTYGELPRRTAGRGRGLRRARRPAAAAGRGPLVTTVTNDRPDRPTDLTSDRSSMTLSTIAVIGGTGPQGKGLGFRFAAAGHPVVLGSRSADRAVAAAEELAAGLPGSAGITGAENAKAAESADLVLLAVPYDGHAELVAALRAGLAGKVVISCVNPLGFDKRGPFGLAVEEGSAAEQAAALLPDSQRDRRVPPPVGGHPARRRARARRAGRAGLR